MSKWSLAAGAAAMALAVPALADPGNGHGGGGPKAQGGAAPRAEHGGGAARIDHGGGGAVHGSGGRGGGKLARQQAAPASHVRSAAWNHAAGKAMRPAHAEQRMARIDSGQARKPAHTERAHDLRGADSRPVDVRSRPGDVRVAANEWRGLRGLADSCPPGLARKGNGCFAPGQAKKLVGAALPASLAAASLSGPFSQWYRDDDRYFYRNDGDYIYRVDRQGGLVDSLFPMQDRDYSYYPIGMTYPAEYNSYNVPYQYRSLYPDGDDYHYRYGDGAIYQVNQSNGSIESIVALLAGDLGVGQELPGDYGVYNVPLAYRDRYYDTPDAMYRYNDGYIYQADPKTQLITAVIDALA